MSEELQNIESHLTQFNQRTDRPLHMDVLHVCSDLAESERQREEAEKRCAAMRVQLVRFEACEPCGGSGMGWTAAEWGDCPTCKGTGKDPTIAAALSDT